MTDTITLTLSRKSADILQALLAPTTQNPAMPTIDMLGAIAELHGALNLGIKAAETAAITTPDPAVLDQYKPGVMVRATRDVIGAELGDHFAHRLIVSEGEHGEVQRVDTEDLEGLPVMVEFEKHGRRWIPLDAIEPAALGKEGGE